MDEDPTAEEAAVDGESDEPDDADASTETETETETETDTEPADADPAAKASTETVSTETEEPPGSDPEARVSEEAEPDAEEGATGSPGMVPPKTDERIAPGGIPQTTTTGDPDKDVGGPSVTEESRRQMEGDDALDEPGYGDLGHAEDLRILRDD